MGFYILRVRFGTSKNPKTKSQVLKFLKRLLGDIVKHDSISTSTVEFKNREGDKKCTKI